MKDQKFYTYSALVFLFAFAAAVTFNILESYPGFLAGFMVLSGFFTMRLALAEASKRSKTQNMKMTLVLISPLYEAVILLGVVFSDIIPGYLIGISLISVLLTKIIEHGFSRELRELTTPFIGQDIRILTLSVGFILSEVNIYYIFYSVVLITLIALYDSIRMIYDKKKCEIVHTGNLPLSKNRSSASTI